MSFIFEPKWRKKANGKALAGATPYVDKGKRKLALSALFKAHFNPFVLIAPFLDLLNT